jgi:hypothetical protein
MKEWYPEGYPIDGSNQTGYGSTQFTRLWKQGAEKNRTQPIVMRLTGRESEMDRQAIGVYHRVNLAGQTPSRATHILLIVVRDAGSVLVHAHDGGIDHLHGRVVTGGQCIHDPVPDASLPPTDKAIIPSGASVRQSAA